MSYIDYINRFWQCEIERAIAPSDAKLYFYLLHTCNTLRWKQPFGHSDRHLSMLLGMAVNTVRDSKNRLKEMGLIDFSTPDKKSKGIDGQTKFWFPATVSNSDTVETANQSLTTPSTVSIIDTVHAQSLPTVSETVSNSDTVPDQTPSTVSESVSNFDRVSDTNKREDKNNKRKNNSAAPAALGSFQKGKPSKECTLTHKIRLTIQEKYPDYYWDAKDGAHAKKCGAKLQKVARNHLGHDPADSESVNTLKWILTESEKLSPYYRFRDMASFNTNFNQIITQIKSKPSLIPNHQPPRRSFLEIK